MTRLLDCLVSYFGLDEDDRPALRRYFCYHILAGPGPTKGSGVASITMVAVYDASRRCDSCHRFHAVEAGGPETALATAVRYLDAYHERDHVLRVPSDVRDVPGGEQGLPRSPEASFHAAREWLTLTPKG